MPGSLITRLKFRLERFLLGGAPYQLVFIALVIALISIIGGAVVALVPDREGGFLDAVWWAFLRLSDPGYLGDDEGLVARIVSTILTVLGYVLFMGSLVAIMTQWLMRTMRELETGLTPITQKGHVLILGWTDRTPSIVLEILSSTGRLRRFLQRIGRRKLSIVILAEEVSTRIAQELRESLGDQGDMGSIVLRSGLPMRLEDLRRVNAPDASVIVLPGGVYSSKGSTDDDGVCMKTLLTIASQVRDVDGPLPYLVTELFDHRRIDAARSAYGGPVEIVPSNRVVASCMAQNIRHPGLSHVYTELFTYTSGSALYVRDAGPLAGERLRAALHAYPRAIPLGVLRPVERGLAPTLSPARSFQIREEDLVVFVAGSWEDTLPTRSIPVEPGKDTPSGRADRSGRTRRVLLLGWSQKVPAIVRELDGHPDEEIHLDIASVLSDAERRAVMDRLAVAPSDVQVRHVEADFTSPSELARLAPSRYDNVVIVASDRIATGEEADARTIMGYLLVCEQLGGADRTPDILVELLDPDSRSLLGNRPGEVIVSSRITSHMLAHVAMRRELGVAFDALFGPGGSEICFRQATEYGLDGDTLTFAGIQDRVIAAGDIALGVVEPAGSPGAGIHLNPDRQKPWSLGADAGIVVLSSDGS